MIISHRFKFVFFSNPETGSDAVCRVLAPFADEPVVPFHSQSPERPYYTCMSPSEAAIAFFQNNRNLADYVCISSIENPFTRLPRVYDRILEEDKFKTLRRLIGQTPPSFDRWLIKSETGGRGGGGSLQDRWRRFGTWTSSNWSAGFIEHFIRREHMAEDLNQVISELQLPIPMLAAESALQMPTRPLGRNATEIISIRYRDDLVAFDYCPSDTDEVAA